VRIGDYNEEQMVPFLFVYGPEGCGKPNIGCAPTDNETLYVNALSEKLETPSTRPG